MIVQVLFQPDCPGVALMTDRIAMAARGLDDVEVEVVERSFADLAVLGGSPTVLIDGVDPFPAADRGREAHCRLYRTPAGIEGAPSIDDLRAALDQASTPGNA